MTQRCGIRNFVFRNPRLFSTILLFIFSCGSGFSAGKKGQSISYNRDIRPILSENCFYCHCPDPNKRKAKMRLDIREQALEKKAFVPGKP